MIYNPIIPVEEFWVPLNILDIRPNIYEISNYGNVRRIEDKFPIKQQVLMNEYGSYRLVNLVTTHSSQPKKYLVHRLVGFVFIPNPYNLEQINHMNNNGMDNCNLNLEWASGEYNTNYQYKIKDIFLDNKMNYKIYKLLEGGYDYEYIKNHMKNPLVDNDYIDMIKDSYIRNNPISEFDESERRVNSSRFPNSTTEYVCQLFQSGMTYKDYRHIAELINVELKDEAAAITFRAYCRNLYTRKHHTHISNKYTW